MITRFPPLYAADETKIQMELSGVIEATARAVESSGENGHEEGGGQDEKV